MDQNFTVSIPAEQAVLGALMRDNDALDRISDVQPEHFYRHDHRLVFEALLRQIVAGKRADVITVAEAVEASVEGGLQYLGQLHQSAASASTIRHHADIVIDRAKKRQLAALALEMHEMAISAAPAMDSIDASASRLEALAKQDEASEPRLLISTVGRYVEVVQQRMEGKIKPVATGFIDLDAKLDGGVERGTLTVIAGRPGMGKTAFGLGIARNVAEEGVSLVLSMEMSETQLNDRNIAALGELPLAWLKKPKQHPHPGEKEEENQKWDRLSAAVSKAESLRMYLDDKAGLNMLEIRAKARAVKRKAGSMDALVIDQLSFIKGSKAEKSYEAVGEYTRGLVALAKELDCAVFLLCQLNRECEKRPNKRPIMSDLAQSGSIEQDAAYIIFPYRDEVYTKEKCQQPGVCEVEVAKSRQGEPGRVGLAYIGNQTRFANLAYQWTPPEDRPQQHRSGGGFE